MTEETGRIVALYGNQAEVEVSAGAACERCGAAALCNWTGKRTRRILARNPHCSVAIGQLVVIGRGKRASVRSALAVFGLPAGMLLLGTIIGAILDGDRLAAILGGLGLLLGMTVVLILERITARQGNSLPVILRVTESDKLEGDTREDSPVDHADNVNPYHSCKP